MQNLEKEKTIITIFIGMLYHCPTSIKILLCLTHLSCEVRYE